jgi:hypothetical protein
MKALSVGRSYGAQRPVPSLMKRIKPSLPNKGRAWIACKCAGHASWIVSRGQLGVNRQLHMGDVSSLETKGYNGATPTCILWATFLYKIRQWSSIVNMRHQGFKI